MAFADHYTRDAHAATAALSWWRADELSRARPGIGKADHADHDGWKRAREADKADMKAFDAHEEGAWRRAVEAHLLELRSAGRLNAIAGAKGRKINFALSWNAFVAGGAIDADRWLVREFDRVVVWAVVTAKYDALDADASWAGICAAMDAGDSSPFGAMQNIEAQDAASGERCEVAFTGWKAALMRRTGNGGLEAAPALKKRPLTRAELLIATGDVILTDYLRAGTPAGGGDGRRDETPFTRAIDLGDEEHGSKYDVGSDDGRAERTLEHAARHAMGYVQTTNTSVVVHRRPSDGALLVSRRWNPGERGQDADGDAACPGWDKVGTFSCDMWRITCMDVSAAHDLMRKGGDAAPEATLETYLAGGDCYAGNVVRTRIPPGRWRLHAGEDFSRRADRKALGIPKGISPWMMLEPIGAAAAA